VLAGVFLVAGAMLLYELTLTRVYSALLGYHLSFVAISVALLGTAAAGVAVYLKPAWFPAERTRPRMAQAAIAFAVTSVAAFRLGTALPVDLRTPLFDPSLMLLYLASTPPMLFAGIVVCLGLARYRNAGAVYAADLAGAAAGCAAFVALAGQGELPGLIALLGAGCLAGRGLAERRLRRALGAALALVLAALVGAATGALTIPFRLPYTDVYATPLFDRMNAFSRVVVLPASSTPFGWGMSDRLPGDARAGQLAVFIDALAGTILTEYRGETASVDYLRYDVTNLAHHVRPGGRVYVMGAGGGRDILCALLFGATRVVATEINPIVAGLLTRDFAAYTGRLTRDARVSLHVGDARSFLAGHAGPFDVIMSSLTDTFAATRAGAFTLTENSLYTRQGWALFLRRLAPSGILSFSRWWTLAEPSESLRLVALARAALDDLGAAEPAAHVAMLGTKTGSWPGSGVAAILVRRAPWDPADLHSLDAAVERYGFTWLLDPRGPGQDPFRELLRTPSPEAFLARYPRDVSPPDDDRPFFFFFVKAGDLVGTIWRRAADGPVAMLLTFTALIAGLLGACVLGPMAAHRRARRAGAPARDGATGWDLTLFMAIGGGFIFIEIALLERLVLLLGHPSYSLSVVLATLLLAAGAGSAWVERRPPALPRLAALLLVTVLGIGLAAPAAVTWGAALPLPARVALAAALVAPVGLGLGTILPLAVRSLAGRDPEDIPWMWAVNGVASVLGAVLALVLSLIAGITATYAGGAALYALATLALARTGRRRPADVLY
jgi:hypothetical protein